MRCFSAFLNALAVSVFFAGAANAFAAGFVKSADVGGYKVVVEGGGVEERKEIQYDSAGNVIYDSRNSNLRKLFGGGEKLDDASLFGGGNGGLELENLGGALPKKSAGKNVSEKPGTSLLQAAKIPVSEKKSDKSAPDSADLAGEKNPADAVAGDTPRKMRSPWAPSLVRKIPPNIELKESENAQKMPAENSDVSEKKLHAEDDSILLDPKNSLLQQPMTDDGRKLPFYIGGSNGGKGQIDPNSTLKNFMKINDGLARTRDFGEAVGIETTDRYDNVITMDQWHSKFSSLGARRADNYSRESALGESRYSGASKTFERNVLENDLMWSRSRESRITVDNSLAQKITERYSTGNATKHGAMRLAAPGERGGLSMQDINRYQFRRSHSDEAGLPVVSPGGNGVSVKK